MTTCSIEELSPVDRKLTIEIDAETATAELESIYKQLNREARIPGFRPGKAPKRIIVSAYKDRAERDLVMNLVDLGYREALKQHRLEPVSQPELKEKLDLWKEGEPFKFTLHVEVKPAIILSGFEELEIKERPVEVSDAEVERELERIQRALATPAQEKEERKVAKVGDMALAELEVTDFPAPAEGQGSEPQRTMRRFFIQEGPLARENLAQLAGLEVGGKAEFTHQWPPVDPLDALANAEAGVAPSHGVKKITATLLQFEGAQLPAIDDELAKKLQMGETLAELREKVRARIDEVKRQSAEERRRDSLVQQLLAKTPFEAPKSMVEGAFQNAVGMVEAQMQRQGAEGELSEELKAKLREMAVARVKRDLLLEAIIEKEGLQLSQEDLTQAMRSAEMPREVRKEDQGLLFQRVWQMARDRKALAFLESKAKRVAE